MEPDSFDFEQIRDNYEATPFVHWNSFDSGITPYARTLTFGEVLQPFDYLSSNPFVPVLRSNRHSPNSEFTILSSIYLKS